MLQKGCSYKFEVSPQGLPAPHNVAATPGHHASLKAAPMGALLLHVTAPKPLTIWKKTTSAAAPALLTD